MLVAFAVVSALLLPPPAAAPQQLPRLAEADSLFRAHDYLGLERWLERPGARALRGIAFFEGIVDNRRDRNASSVTRLAPLLTDALVRADSAHRHVLLQVLADDYGKLYQYADAARMLEMVEREFGSAMPAGERLGLEATVHVRQLLATAPAQRTTIPSGFDVPLRRNAIGVLEAPARVASDSSWWIIDTGANFSTVTESTARRLGLELSKDSAATAGVTGALVRLRIAVVPSLKLGTAEVRNMVVLVLPDSALYVPQMKYQISAILGYPLLEALQVVTLAPDKLTVSTSASTGAETDLFLEQLNPLIAATVDGRTGLYHLDTGANRSTLTVHFRDMYPALFTVLTADTSTMRGASGASSFRAYTLADLRMSLGAHEVTLHKITVLADPARTPFGRFLGNLGQDVIDGATLTLDFRRMKVVLDR